jgi:hypothetical protein
MELSATGASTSISSSKSDMLEFRCRKSVQGTVSSCKEEIDGVEAEACKFRQGLRKLHVDASALGDALIGKLRLSHPAVQGSAL